MLDKLFGGSVEQADVRNGFDDDFSLEFEHQTEHTVSSWMLWTKIENHVLQILFSK